MKNDKIDILVIDDRPENLVAIEAILDFPGYNLIKATSGTDALKYLLDHDCALILMDVQMPDMDGFETASYIKQSLRSRNIPIIFITALSKEKRFVHQGYQSGAVDYIFKPFEAAILRSKVDVFVELYRAKEEIKRQSQMIHDSDVKDRERAIAQLEVKSLRRDQIAQKKYRDLVDGIKHGIIWAAELETLSFSFVSPSAQSIIGYGPEAWCNDANFLMTKLYEQDRVCFLEAVAKAKAGDEPGFEHRFLNANGKTTWFHTGLRIAPKGESEEYELQGLSVDITPIKEAEAALRKSEARSRLVADVGLALSESLEFEVVLQKVGDLTVPGFADWYSVELLDENERGAFLSIAAYDRQAPLCFSCFKRPSTNALAPPTALLSILKQGQSQIIENFSPELLAGIAPDPEPQSHLEKTKPRAGILVPLRNRGKVFGLITFLKRNGTYDADDLSVADDIGLRAASSIDNASLYRQAQVAISARNEFLSVASHELKTPLTALMLQMQSLQRSLQHGRFSELSAAKLSKIVGMSDRQISRLAKLIDHLLDISKINMGRLNLEIEPMSLGELVSEVVDRLSEEMSAGKYHLELKINGPGQGKWDRFRIEQIIVNLLTNAMKYGEAKPIEVELTEDAHEVLLKVRDHGIGIDKKDQARIFERFERAVSPMHFGGLGLGLYIVKELVTLHQGTIEVESAPGEGSTFIVKMPKELRKEDLINPEPSAEASPRFWS